MISVGVNVALGVSLFFTLGFQGIALATSAASWITVLQMVVRLKAREIWTPSARATGKMIRVALASVGMGLAVAVATHFRTVLESPFHGERVGSLIAVLAVAVTGALIYVALLFAFGGVTPSEMRTAFKRRKGDVAAPAADLS
jgi:putative peptidoglycan lipid II flippase